MNDGGPAFPNTGITESGTPFTEFQGLSVLDYFAGQALAGFLAGDLAKGHARISGPGSSTLSPVTVADLAYDMAAALIAERQKRMS